LPFVAEAMGRGVDVATREYARAGDLVRMIENWRSVRGVAGGQLDHAFVGAIIFRKTRRDK
jgi:hypothetical protein